MKIDNLVEFFAIVGAFSFICIAIFLFYILHDALYKFIEEKKYERIRKHRFDKPPTAKCYCKDCKYWRKDDGRCFYFETRCTADCWFCWNAEPLTHKEYAERGDNRK